MSTFVPVTPDQVTIAVTVYSRREYIKRAVASALGQTHPVRVIVVEDCGPDPALQAFVTSEFGGRIEYFRNPRRRGLFDNWNACLEHCKTAWVSILHDDDYLTPNFVESMLKLSRQQPGCALYYGLFKVVDEAGKPRPELGMPPVRAMGQRITLQDVYQTTPLAVAGTLFSVTAALSAGGFRASSQFAGDWEMWSKLIARHGAAATPDHVAVVLTHSGHDRGSTVVERNGKWHALNYVQRKRILALMRQQGICAKMDRRREQALMPTGIRFLLAHGAQMSPRLLRYNLKLLNLSKSPNWRHAVAKAMLGLLGTRVVRGVSRLCSRFVRK